MIQVGAIMFEVCEVLLSKMQMLGIEGLKVTVEELAGDAAVKGLVEIVHFLKHPGGVIGNLAIGGPGRNMIRPGSPVMVFRGGWGRRGIGGEEWEKQPAAQD